MVNKRDGEGSASAAPRSSSPPAPRVSSPPAPRVSSPLAPPGTSSSPAAPGVSSPAAPGSSSPPSNQHPIQATNSFGNSTSVKQEVVASDEFDPRGSLPGTLIHILTSLFYSNGELPYLIYFCVLANIAPHGFFWYRL